MFSPNQNKILRAKNNFLLFLIILFFSLPSILYADLVLSQKTITIDGDDIDWSDNKLLVDDQQNDAVGIGYPVAEDTIPYGINDSEQIAGQGYLGSPRSTESYIQEGGDISGGGHLDFKDFKLVLEVLTSYQNNADSSGDVDGDKKISLKDALHMIQKIQTVPSTPAELTAVAADGAVTVSWKAVAWATSYKVYWKTVSNGETADSLIVATESPLSHTDLTNGTTYSYHVSAVNLAGESGLSTEVSATPQALPLPAPTGVSASPGSGSVTISWTYVPGTSAYKVYWDTNGNVTTADPSLSTTSLAYLQSGLTNDTTYYYRISALNASGSESALSEQVSAKPTGAAAIRLIACGDYNSFLVTSYGDLYAWGKNNSGQLGIGSFSYQYKPVYVSGISDVVAVSASRYHTLALTGSGRLYAWGENDYGQLGNGSTQTTWYPTLVSGRSDFIAIAAGRLHSLGVTADGQVWAWGRNSSGQLGLGHDDGQLVPSAVNVSITEPGFVFAGDGDSFFKAGTIGVGSNAMYSWGSNSGGQLGRGLDLAFPNSPSAIAAAVHALAGSTRLHHVLVLREGNTVLAWGINQEGQLGNGSTTGSAYPIGVNLVDHVIAVAAGYFHSLALGDDGRIMSWGNNGFGQLGDGTWDMTTIRTWVSGLTNVKKIATGGSHSLAVRGDGTVWAWGNNTYGELGNNSIVDSNVPVRVIGY